jgi:tetratricopeptide (TPR) repeat protein
MRLRVLLSFLVFLLVLGSLTLWKRAQGRAVLEHEAQFSKPLSDALVAFQQKRYVDAEAMLSGLLAETERDSPDSIHLASVLHGLGAVTYLQHRDSEAEAYYKRAVEIRKRLLKPDDPELLSSLCGLAQALRDEGNSAEADQYNREILAIYQQHPEMHRGDYGMYLLNVGVFASRRHRLEEAQRLLAEAEANFERFEGARSQHAALASTSLAEVYEHEGKYSESEALYRKALAVQEAQLSPDDADLGRTLDGLADIRFKQGYSSEAASLRTRARAIYEKAGPSPSTSEAVVLNERGQSRAADGKYKEAESLYKQAVEEDEAKYGPNNTEVAEYLGFLARLYRDQSGFKMQEAEPLFHRMLSIRQKAFGPGSPEVAETVSDIALLYFFEKDYGHCESFAARALPIQENTFGPSGLEVSTTLNRLGICQRDLNNLAEAEVSLARALAIREKFFQPDHPWIAISVQNLASVYRAQGQVERAALLLANSRAASAKTNPNR